MTLDEYKKLPAAEQKFSMQCPDCREMFDLRNLENIVLHLAHRSPPRPAFRIADSRFFAGLAETPEQDILRRLLAISRRREAMTTAANPIRPPAPRSARCKRPGQQTPPA